MSQSRVVDASDKPVPDSPVQFHSSNFVSLNGSGSDLDGTGTRPGITFAQIKEQIAQIPTVTGRMSRME